MYPAESFAPVTHYGLRMMVSGDEGLKHYLSQVLKQISGVFPIQERHVYIFRGAWGAA